MPTPLLFQGSEAWYPISVAEFEAAFARDHPSITYPGLHRVAAPTAVATAIRPMRIVVKTLTRQGYWLRVKSSDTIREVKEQIFEKTG